MIQYCCSSLETAMHFMYKLVNCCVKKNRHHCLYQISCCLSPCHKRSIMDNSSVDAAIPNEQKRNINDLITIDASYGEGGGQLVRNACAYAAILQLNIHLVNIRQNRKPKPGIQRQHLTAITLLKNACHGKLAKKITNLNDPPEVGDNEVIFIGNPSYFQENTFQGDSDKVKETKDKVITHTAKKLKYNNPRTYIGDTETAGSICLLLQAVLPYGLFASANNTDDDDDVKFHFILKGGTNATMAPQIDYFEHVFLPILQKNCIEPSLAKDYQDGNNIKFIDTDIVRRGFYPRGGGEVHVTITPPANILNSSSSDNSKDTNDKHSSSKWTLSPIQLTDRGEIIEIIIRSYVGGNCHKSMPQKLIKISKSILQFSNIVENVPVSTIISEYKDNVLGSGCGIILIAKTSTGYLLGGSAIGTPKTSLEETAKQATMELLDGILSNACVDIHLQDQLIIYMALANGVSEITTNGLTKHTQTAIWLAQQLCPGVQFEINKLTDDTNVNSVEESKKLLTSTTTKIEADIKNDGYIPGLHVIRCLGIGFSPN